MHRSARQRPRPPAATPEAPLCDGRAGPAPAGRAPPGREWRGAAHRSDAGARPPRAASSGRSRGSRSADHG